jgi:hypothetical protein
MRANYRLRHFSLVQERVGQEESDESEVQNGDLSLSARSVMHSAGIMFATSGT